MRFSQDFIGKVEDASDIVSVIQEHGVLLTAAGSVFKGLCPFHSEKTPSFNVNPHKQFFYCFGCHKGGGVLKFLMEYEHLSFQEAIKELATRASITLEYQDHSTSQAEKINPYYGYMEAAKQYYHQQLLSAPVHSVIQQYLKQRQLSPELCKKFEVGFAPEGWQNLQQVRQPELEASMLLKTGLCKRSDSGRFYDFFRSRLMFPIRDTKGRTIAFGGRSIEENQKPKYLNSSENLHYQKSKVLYGLYEGMSNIKRSRQLLVVEGYMDVLRLHEYGFECAVAPCGTALTLEHIRKIQAYVDSVTLLFDGDQAGRNAALKSARLFLSCSLDVQIVTLPEQEDPDSLLHKKGRHGMEEFLKQGVPLLDYLVQETMLRYGSSSQEILSAVEALLPDIQQIQKEELRQLTLVKLSEKIRLPLKTILKMSETLISSKNHARVANFHPETDKGVSRLDERWILYAVLVSRDLLKFAFEHIAPSEFLDLTYREIYQALQGVSESNFKTMTIEQLTAALPQYAAALMEIYMEDFPVEHAQEQMKRSIHRLKQQQSQLAFEQKIHNASDEAILQASLERRRRQTELRQFFQR